MKKMFLLFVGILALCLCSSASATPISVGGPLAGTGDGANSHWVDVNYSPHNVDQALSALGLTAGDPGYLGEVHQVVSAIDFADSALNGYVSGYTTDPLTPDGSFAVEYTGYLNITSSDTYSFNAYTDDGFRLVIGGETISQHYGDRAPGSTVASVFLNAGLYEFSMIGWEQGGVFVNELSWHDSSTSSWSLVDSDVLFTNNPPNNPIPEPATMSLFALGLLGLAGVSRKKTA